MYWGHDNFFLYLSCLEFPWKFFSSAVKWMNDNKINICSVELCLEVDFLFVFSQGMLWWIVKVGFWNKSDWKKKKEKRIFRHHSFVPLIFYKTFDFASHWLYSNIWNLPKVCKESTHRVNIMNPKYFITLK